jgi:hypothetical protein
MKAASRREEEKKRRDHEARAKGGGVGAVPENEKEESYAGTGSRTEKEAERRKRGGAVMRKGKMPHMIHGSAPRHHGNRPGRKGGGSVGADSHPMTEASRLSMPEGMHKDYGKLDREDD